MVNIKLFNYKFRSELVDESNYDNKIWIRASTLAERLWNPNVADVKDVAKRLIATEYRFISRGYKPAPVTNRWCSIDDSRTDECFGNIKPEEF